MIGALILKPSTTLSLACLGSGTPFSSVVVATNTVWYLAAQHGESCFQQSNLEDSHQKIWRSTLDCNVLRSIWDMASMI